MNLIGINGFKTSGKDTTYKIVDSILENQRVVRRAFADKLKIMAAKALGYEGEDAKLIALMDDLKDQGIITIQFAEFGTQNTRSGRQYLQDFGGRAREVFGDSFWVDQVLPRPQGVQFPAVELRRRFDNANWGCVTDVRYPNEAQRVLDLGGEVWEVVRSGLESDGHSSEVPLPRHLVTQTILNDGTLDDLCVRISNALERFGSYD